VVKRTPIIIDSFRVNESSNIDNSLIETNCYIRNTQDQFKKYWAVIKGKELFCYKEKNAEKCEVMHSLANIFVEISKPFEAKDLKQILYPVKIVLAKTKLRVLYFDSEERSEEFTKILKKIANLNDVYDFYKIIDELGKGQFGVVKLASHKGD